MKLINLQLNNEPLSISISAEGHIWDLHNAFDFDGVHQNIRERSVILSWQRGQYGECPVPVHSIAIVFEGVDYFEVTPRDAEIPGLGEDVCLNYLSRVPLEDDTRALLSQGAPLMNSWEEQFHLWFAFRGGQHIRLGAKTATFKAIYTPERTA